MIVHTACYESTTRMKLGLGHTINSVCVDTKLADRLLTRIKDSLVHGKSEMPNYSDLSKLHILMLPSNAVLMRLSELGS